MPEDILPENGESLPQRLETDEIQTKTLTQHDEVTHKYIYTQNTLDNHKPFSKEGNNEDIQPITNERKETHETQKTAEIKVKCLFGFLRNFIWQSY